MGRWLLGAAVALVAMLGMRLYDEASAHDGAKARLVALCETDVECRADVEKHYDACFGASHTTGGGRSSSSLDTNALVRCVNRKSGVPYFAIE